MSMNAFWLFMALGLWGFLHSWLASHRVKRFFQQRWGTFYRAYRLFYNLFASVTFLPILWLVAFLPDRLLYTLRGPWMFLAFFGQGMALLMLAIALLQTDVWQFLGLRPERPGRLVRDGFYRFMRHPLYTFGLLFLWLSPRMTFNQFLLSVGITVYILIGASLEERKLLQEFGSAYEEYRSQTPMLFPLRFKR
jgi:protein-S-isoprenylcysteine O-methyltransferase Ste14